MEDSPSYVMLARRIERLRERVRELEAALGNVERTLGPTSCRCDGLQVEVDMALEAVRTALSGGAADGDARMDAGG